MAVDGYQQLIVAPCIDNSVLQTNFDSLNALATEMNKGTVDVTCDPIDVSMQGRNGLGEESEVIFAKLPINTLGREDEKCLFLLAIKFEHKVLGDTSFVADHTFTYSIKCNGVTAYQNTASSGPVFSDFINIDCPKGSEIEIVANIQSPITSVDFEWFADFCGGRLCLSERDIRTSGATVPCTVKPECKYGFDALSLMVQSLNALGTAFAFGGKTVRCVSVNATDNESIAVSANMAANTTYAVFGHIEVCLDDPTNEDNRVIVQPVIGCESSQASCLTGVVQYEPTESGLIKECTRIPVITCGQCLAGDSLFVGQNPELQCNEVADQDPGTFGYSLNAEYCIWLFEDVTNDNEIVPYPPRCITTNYLVKLRDKGDDIHEKACLREIPNCTIRDRSFFTDGHPNGPQPALMIQAGVPFVPPPENPAAVEEPKKWYLTGSVQICHEVQTTNIEETHLGVVNYQILCGGVPYVAPSGVPFYGECRWELASSGVFRSCSPVLNIVGNIECLASDDLEIVITGSSQTNSFPFNGPWTTILDIKAICF